MKQIIYVDSRATGKNDGLLQDKLSRIQNLISNGPSMVRWEE